MKIWIGLVSSSDAVKRYFGEQKRAVIPPEGLRRGIFADFDIEITTNVFTETLGADAIEQFVKDGSLTHNVSMLVIDENMSDFADGINGYTFVIRFSPSEVEYNPKNSFNRIFANALKNIDRVGQWISGGGKTQEIICLPLRNFHAPELAEILNIFKQRPLSGNLYNDVEHQLGVMRRERVRPRKRAKNAKVKFIIDDRRRYFDYGKEHHSLPETGEHRASCAVAAHFRFGYALIDPARHYNVSDSDNDDTYVDGEFCNCHNVGGKERRETHLNMFSSDMYY